MAQITQGADDRQGHGHIVLLLSLKLILLAFFILLNAISDFEEQKTREAIESVNRAFSGKIEGLPRPPPEAPSLGTLPNAENLLSEVGSLFESLVPSAQTEVSDRAGKMRVDLPASALFEPDADRVRPDRRLLISRLAGVLRPKAGGRLVYTLEFVHEFSASTQGRIVGAGVDALEVRRAGVLSDRLTGEGVPGQRLAVALLPGRPDMIQFIVRVRQDGPADDESGAPAERDR